MSTMVTAKSYTQDHMLYDVKYIPDDTMISSTDGGITWINQYSRMSYNKWPP
jgi:hypothetical protein